VVYGISVAEKKIVWLKVQAEGVAATAASRAIKTRDRLGRARSAGCSTNRPHEPRRNLEREPLERAIAHNHRSSTS
jgi:hypothetical protein